MKDKVIRFEPNSTQAKAVISLVRQHEEFIKSLQERAKNIAISKFKPRYNR